MLTHLIIDHLSIIQRAELSFTDGFTILTGETGAGKSVVLSAIGLLMGKQASESMIYRDAEKAFVEGVFESLPKPVLSYLSEHFDSDEETLIVSRTLSRSRNSHARVNGHVVTLKQLKDLMQYLVLYVGQHDNILFSKKNGLLTILDTFIPSISAESQTYLTAYSQYKKYVSELKLLKETHKLSDQHIEFLSFQLNELKQHHLEPNEDTVLQDQKKQIKSFKQLNQLSQTLYSQEKSYETKLGELQSLSLKCDPDLTTTKQIESLIHYLDEGLSKFTDVRSSFSEALSELNHLDIDSIEVRLDELYKLKTKFNVNSVEALLDMQVSLETQLKDIASFDDRVKSLNASIESSRQDSIKHAKVLHDLRNKQAKSLESSVNAHLETLDMKHTSIKLDLIFDDENLSTLGGDSLSLLVATNYSGNYTAFSETASGGEQSRLFLSIYAEIVSHLTHSIIIFDEIDVGIGGLTAVKVGQFVSGLAKKKQLLCVTHLAQIAKEASQHFIVHKSFVKDAVNSTVTLLSPDKHRDEIKRMIGGESVLEVIQA